MTSIATVTPVSQTVKASGEGLAEHAFSVTNITGASLTVGVKVLVDPPAQEGWFTIGGAAERELAANETDQITVTAKLPADTQPGQYKLRLLVFSAVRGDAGENFTEGPTVTLDVPVKGVPAPAPAREPKPFPWWIVAVAAALLLVIGGLIAWLVWPEGETGAPEVAEAIIPVPRIVEMRLPEAQEKLVKAGLAVGEVKYEYTGSRSGGTVLSQVPPESQPVPLNTPVTLTVEAESVSVLPPGGPIPATYPLVVRGGANLGMTEQPSQGAVKLIIVFQFGTRPAGAGLVPGEGSWLDRGQRPGEPNRLEAQVSKKDARTVMDYLGSPAHFYTFQCFNTGQGYMSVTKAYPQGAPEPR